MFAGRDEICLTVVDEFEPSCTSSVTTTSCRPTFVVLQTSPLKSTLTTNWFESVMTLVSQDLVTSIPGVLTTVGQSAVVESVIVCCPPSLEAALTLTPLVGALPTESKLSL